MKTAPSDQERAGGVRTVDATLVPASEDRRVQIISAPFRLQALAGWGVVLFAGAFFVGRELRVADSGVSVATAETQQVAAQTAPQTAPPLPASSVTPTTSDAPAEPEAKRPRVVAVEIRLMKFNPASVELNAGDTIEWKNRDITPHTATAEDKKFDSGPINANASWSYTFSNAGTFSYMCTFHPEMKGTVVVR